MARVDLRCTCGHKFFVSDAQLTAPGGVECPACLEPMKIPSNAGKLPSKAASKGVESSTAKLLAAVAQPVADLPPPKKKLIVMAAVGATVVAVIAVIVTLLLKSSSGVDYDKQAQEAVEARKRQYEELSRKDGKSTPPAASPTATPVAPNKSTPAAAPTPNKAPEYKPMPASATPVTSPAPTNPPPPAPPVPADASSVAVGQDQIARLRSEVLELNPFYLNLVVTPAEKARLNAVVASGRGTPEDTALVEGLLGGPKLKAVKDEIALVAQSLPTLERESSENLPVDRITYIETGRVLNCRILEEGTDVVKVSRALAGGVGGQMPIRRDAIRIEKGKGIGVEFASRWETARKGPAAAQVELLSWCKDNTLTGQARLLAFTILRADPSHAFARGEAGLPADPVKNAEELAKGGLIPYQGKNWNPKQLRDKFIADGFYLLNGSWYSKKDKMITVPGLFAYERQKDKPVIFSGLPLCHETETTYKKVADGEQPEIKYIRRFYAPELKTQLSASIPPTIVVPPPTIDLETKVLVDAGLPAAGTKMQGDVSISVPVGALILEASVITTAEVKAGGSISVYLVGAAGSSEPGKRTKLYDCDPKEKESHVIPPELVRGSTEVNLVAVFDQLAAYTPKLEKRRVRNAVYRKAEKGVISSPAVDIQHHQLIPDYKAMLFPSNSNTIEVFRLRVGIAEPAPQLDKVFAANPEALK